MNTVSLDESSRKRIEEMVQRGMERVRTGKANMDGLVSVVKKKANLRRAIEEAEWLGEAEQADNYYHQIQHLDDSISKGYLYEPEW